MRPLIDILIFTLGLILFLKTIKKIFKGEINAYTIFSATFFGFHFPSLLIDNTGDDRIEEAFGDMSNLYKALTDDTISIIYDVSILLILLSLYNMSRKGDNFRFQNLTDKLKRVTYPKALSFLLFIGMLVPIVAVFFAPDPSIYLEWAYTYRYSISSVDELYNDLVMANCLTLAFFCIITYALGRNSKQWVVYLFVAIITWLSFKRTLLVFSVLIILFIDFFKGRYVENFGKAIRKTIILLLTSISYFIYYSLNTGKLADAPFYYSYTLYYSRHYCLKAAIMDQLQGMQMLHYRGESLLFDLFFFIPRDIWPDKPSVFTSYFSNFCQGRDIDDQTFVFYYANIWAEFVANFHLIGLIIAFLFIRLVVKISEKSKYEYTYLFGILFITFYFFWGIQPFTMIIIGIWYCCLLRGMFIKNKRLC